MGELTPNPFTVLCLNSGSSSLKFALFSISADREERIASGGVDNIGPKAKFHLHTGGDEPGVEHEANLKGARECLDMIFTALEQGSLQRPNAAGHRVVHGGERYTEPQRITKDLQQDLRELVPLAPLHLPTQIDVIEAISTHYPELPQVACFDTAFHAGMPEIARRLPLPRRLWDKGIRRYGFHGLSYEFILQALGKDSRGRVIVAHLGSGASIAAIHGGKPVDTSMGLTPTGGFMMSTRAGDLDPGVLLYLLRAGYDADQLERLLNRESGLLGVSNCSGDMKTLQEKRQNDPAAEQAIQMFCYEVRKFIGAYAAAMGGLETLIFTGGIGERSASVREEICRGLEFLGVQVNPQLNAQSAGVISEPGSRCLVRVIETDEDLMIARHTAAVLGRMSSVT